MQEEGKPTCDCMPGVGLHVSKIDMHPLLESESLVVSLYANVCCTQLLICTATHRCCLSGTTHPLRHSEKQGGGGGGGGYRYREGERTEEVKNSKERRRSRSRRRRETRL